VRRRDVPEAVAVAALLCVGIAVRILQLVSNRSLWLDEAYLSISIVNRPFAQLLTIPLEYNQVAPPLYLILAKASTLLFGPSEFALRLPAFLCSAGSLLLLIPTARQIVRGPGFYIALAMFAFAPMLVEYAGEAKPYAGDALGAVAVTLCVLQLLSSDFSVKNLVMASAIGVLAVLLSHGSAFVVIGAAATMVGFVARQGSLERLVRVVLVSAAWALGIAMTFWWASQYTANGTRQVMESYWGFAFMPFPPRSLYEAEWLWRAISGAYSIELGVRYFPWLFILAAVVGSVTLWREKRPETLGLLISPLVIVTVCSAARLYPFFDRLTLFVLPSLVLLAALGFSKILSRFNSKVWPALGIGLALVIFPSSAVLFGSAPASRTEEVKPVLAHVSSRWGPRDAIYVFYGATPAMRYYAPRFRLPDSAWTAGTANRGNPRAYLRELDAFRGRQHVWVLFSHDVVPGERKFILGYLDAIGLELSDQNFPQTGTQSAETAVFLYDLSDSARLSRANAESFSQSR
jgi:hypothetical protein